MNKNTTISIEFLMNIDW